MAFALLRRQSLRLRITLAFASMGVLLAGAMSLAAFFGVRSFLEDQRVRSTTRQTVFALVFARDFLDGDSTPEDLVSTLQARSGFDAMVSVPGDWYSTALSLTPKVVPPALTRAVATEQLAYQFTSVSGERKIVFGAPLPPAGTDLYLFYSLEDIDNTMSVLLRVLVVASAAVMAAALIVAQQVSRAILRPLADVSGAAQRVAEGLLETRVATAASDEVGRLAASFNEMAAAFQEMLDRERRFVANVSHELRTPVAALRTASEVLAARRDAMPPVAAEAAGLVAEDVANLQRLVEELLELSEADARGAALRWEEIDLHALAQAVVARARRDVSVHGTSVRTIADKTRVERILTNLLDNAFEHGRGIDVRVAVRADDGWGEIAVSDAGPGIEPDAVPRLFDRFYKGDASRARDRGGVGLGLAIASQYAASLGGSLSATSAPEGRTSFALRLPLRTRAPEETP